MQNRIARTVIATAIATLSVSQLASAQTWNAGGADGNWSTAANWTGGVPLSGSPELIFNTSDSNSSPSANDLSPNPFVFRAMVFNRDLGAFTINGPGALQIASTNIGAQPRRIQNNSAGIVNINVPVTFNATASAQSFLINNRGNQVTNTPGTLNIASINGGATTETLLFQGPGVTTIAGNSTIGSVISLNSSSNEVNGHGVTGSTVRFTGAVVDLQNRVSLGQGRLELAPAGSGGTINYSLGSGIATADTVTTFLGAVGVNRTGLVLAVNRGANTSFTTSIGSASATEQLLTLATGGTGGPGLVIESGQGLADLGVATRLRMASANINAIPTTVTVNGGSDTIVRGMRAVGGLTPAPTNPNGLARPIFGQEIVGGAAFGAHLTYDNTADANGVIGFKPATYQVQNTNFAALAGGNELIDVTANVTVTTVAQAADLGMWGLRVGNGNTLTVSGATPLNVKGTVILNGGTITGGQFRSNGSGLANREIMVYAGSSGTSAISSLIVNNQETAPQTDIYKHGPGTLRIDNDNNTFTGTTIVNGGVLEYTSVGNGTGPTALGSGSGVIQVGDATLRYVGTAAGGHSSTRALTIRGNATLDASGVGKLTLGLPTSGNLGSNNSPYNITLAGTGVGELGWRLQQPTNSTTAGGYAALYKTGTGIWLLSQTTNANNFVGPTSVFAGTLQVGTGSTLGGANALQVLSVFNTGTIAGTGTLAGIVRVESGGTLAPGFSPGTLTASGSSVFFDPGAILSYELDATNQTIGGAFNDLLNVTSATGTLTLDGTLNVTSAPLPGGVTYRLINYSGSLVNNVLNLGTINLQSGVIAFIDTSVTGQVNLVTQIPEPTTLAGLACIGATLLRRRK
jgi:fibronectin-binding autotransporter adhesin